MVGREHRIKESLFVCLFVLKLDMLCMLKRNIDGGEKVDHCG